MSWILTTSGAAISKAGLNANSTITASAATLALWSDESEATLNASTRKDWVADYTGIGANFQKILSETVSDMVAMKIINYDMSGYTSRLEAQTMLDVLRDNITKNITVLKDDRNVEIM